MRRILVIDDEPDILLMLKKMLERVGFEVEIANNGELGLELFQRQSADLVITDIIMPEKEGLEIIREMKKLKADLKIIAISGGGRISASSYLDTATRFGADIAFQKPFRKDELIGAVQELLGIIL